MSMVIGSKYKKAGSIKQVREPNKKLMAVALSEIKGSYRSMADLAKESGISTASLSRIANKNYDRPLAYDTLEALARCAPAGCRYNLEALIEINGMFRDKSEEGQDENKSKKPKPKTHFEKLEVFARTALVMEVQKHFDNSFTVERDNDFNQTGFIANMSYKTSGVSLVTSDQGKYKWVSAVFNSFDPETFGIDPVQKAKRFMEKLSFVFLQDSWDPESLREYKFSAVFDDEQTFTAFVKLLEPAKLHNRFSAILINAYDITVEKEHVFRATDFELEMPKTGPNSGVMGD